MIADDSALLREGLAELLRSRGLDVVATAPDAETLLDAVARQKPDLAVVDIRMPPTHTDEGLRAARTIRASTTSTAVLLLSQGVHAGQALTLFQSSGAGLGYLLKDRVSDVDDFMEAIARVARGGSVIDPEVVQALVSASSGTGALDRLTPREYDVLRLMAEGRSNSAIAEGLRVTSKTIESHVNAILAKLGVEPRVDDNRRVVAVLTYLRAST